MATVSKQIYAKRHGHSRKGMETTTYLSWKSMKARCGNPNHVHYRDYGGRGIKVCPSWVSFPNFLSDMGERPAGMSLDRIDNDGDYAPTNCRWSSATQQRRNCRNTILLSCHAVTLTIAEWSKAIGTPISTIHDRLRRGWTHNQSVFGKSFSVA